MATAENLIGHKFNKLLVLERVGTNLHGSPTWLCKCACGKEIVRPRTYLLGQDNKKLGYHLIERSCGCIRKKIEKPDFYTDFTGKRFGRLIVLNFDKITTKKTRYWLCKCDCGNKKSVVDYNLISGGVKSCGCYSKDLKLANLESGEAGFNKLLRSYIHGAKNRELKFDLSKEEFKILVTGKCTYCGEEPNSIVKSSSEHSIFLYNGIDRVNNEIGYTKENVATCCGSCNKLKGTFERKFFIEQCKKIAKSNE